jgi:hypothetical protein
MRHYCSGSYYFGSHIFAQPFSVQVDCNEDESCTTDDLPEFAYPDPRVYTESTIEYSIDGGNGKFYFDKPTVTTCGGRCRAYYRYEVHTDKVSNVIHPHISAVYYWAYDLKNYDYVQINNAQRSSEYDMSFAIKIISYNEGSEWYSMGDGTDEFSIRNYCGPDSATPKFTNTV